jgi:hypothetical protein
MNTTITINLSEPTTQFIQTQTAAALTFGLQTINLALVILLRFAEDTFTECFIGDQECNGWDGFLAERELESEECVKTWNFR